MENLGIKNLKRELERLNPQVKFDTADSWCTVIIFGTIAAEKLRLPNGYYYNSKNGITNKHQTESGIYESFDYVYDVAHFALHQQEPEPEKSWFTRIFG